VTTGNRTGDTFRSYLSKDALQIINGSSDPDRALADAIHEHFFAHTPLPSVPPNSTDRRLVSPRFPGIYFDTPEDFFWDNRDFTSHLSKNVIATALKIVREVAPHLDSTRLLDMRSSIPFSPEFTIKNGIVYAVPPFVPKAHVWGNEVLLAALTLGTTTADQTADTSPNHVLTDMKPGSEPVDALMLANFMYWALEDDTLRKANSNEKNTDRITAGYRWRTLIAAFDAFPKQLDPTVISTMKSTGTLRSIEIYTWLARSQKFASSREFLNRLQALNAFPSLHAFLTRPSVTEAIDTGGNLVQSLADEIGTSRSIIAILEGARPFDTSGGFDFVGSLEFLTVLRNTARIPGGHRPKKNNDTIKQFMKLAQMFRHAGVLGRPVLDGPEHPIRQTSLPISAHPTEWFVIRERPFWKNGSVDSTKKGRLTIAQTTQEVATAFTRQVLAPVVADEFATVATKLERKDTRPRVADVNAIVGWIDPERDGFSIVGRLLVRDRKIHRLSELFARWETSARHIQHALDETQHSWPPLCDETAFDSEKGRLRIVPLCNAVALAEESYRLKHCVASYSNQCIHSPSHILSIRDDNGKSLSTLHLSVIKEGGRFAVVINEHSGLTNTRPSEAEKSAVASFVKMINSGGILVDWRGLEEQLEERVAMDELNFTAYPVAYGESIG
jgi:hypothetical protein